MDNAATTQPYPEVVDEIASVMAQQWANPSGAHGLAKKALGRLEDAQFKLGDLLEVDPGHITFTSGGTEADNLAIRGVQQARGGQVACSAVEHLAVMDPVKSLGGHVIPVTQDCVVDVESLQEVPSDVSIVSIMAANNETGVIQPLRTIRKSLKKSHPNALIHVDAVQAFCWSDMAEICRLADLVSISGHKFGGAKGVGALITKPNVTFDAQMLGGAQQRGRRAGTDNVAAVVGMVLAAEITMRRKDSTVAKVRALRDKLSEHIISSVDGAVETCVAHGDRSNKLPNIAHFCFEGVEAEALLYLLSRANIMASAAASCSSGAAEPSHVLAACGYERSLAEGSLRLSLGYGTEIADVELVAEQLPALVDQIRKAG